MTSLIEGDEVSLRVDYLGPLCLVVDGHEVPVKRPQVRRLLALLAAREGQNTSSDLLIEHLWSAKPPADPRAALRVVLSRARSDLAGQAHRLEATPTGQRLHAATDAHEFGLLRAEVLEHHDAGRAAELAEEALALWRGEPFGALDDDELQPVARRLVDARWQLATHLAHLYSEAGRHEAVVELTLPMCNEYPHREEVAMLAASAVASTGQTPEGLAILQRCRTTLRDEFGLNAGEQLIELESTLLQGGVGVPSTRPAGVAQPSSGPVVDRHEVLQEVLDASDRPVVVCAEAGAGKSTLLGLVAESLEQAGNDVLFVAAKANPARPLEAMAGLVEQVLAARSEPLPANVQDAVARMFPDLVDAPDVAAPLTRAAMVGSIVALLADESRTYLIDDCQWLDRLSAEVVVQLASSDARLILGTRPELPPYLDFLANPVADVPFANAKQVTLPPISASGASELISSVTGSEPNDQVVDNLLRRSGGNPLFLQLLIDLWHEGALDGDELPVSILVSVQQRMGAMSARARDTVQVASVFGEEFSLGPLRQLAPTADVDIDEATRSGFVVPLDADRFQFRHALLASGAYQLLSSGQRVVLHDEIGRLLEDDGAAAIEFAPHCEEARSIDPARSTSAATRAAGEYALVFDWHRVLEQVDVATAGGALRSRNKVLLELARGRALRALGEDGSVESLFAAARLSESLAEHALFVEAVTELCTYGRTVEFGGLDEELLALLDKAVLIEASAGAQALLFASATTFLAFSEQHERARKLFHQSLALADEADDLEVEGVVLLHAHMGLGHPDDRDLLRSAAARLRTIANGDADLLWEAAFLDFGLAADAGHRAALDRLIVELRSLTPLVQRRNRDFGMAFTESAYALATGDPDAAEQHLGAAVAAGKRLYGDAWSSDLELIILVAVERARGRLAGLLGVAQAALAGRPDFSTLHALIAASAVAAGEIDLAAESLGRVSSDEFAAVIPDFGWKGVMVLLADAVAGIEDRAAAELLYGQLEPFAGTMAWAGVVSFGALDTALAKLAMVLGRAERAAEHQAVADALVAGLFSAPTQVSD